MADKIDFNILQLAHDAKRIGDLLQLGITVSRMPNCNDCGNAMCEYRPKWGQSVRYNCPLHMKEGQEHK